MATDEDKMVADEAMAADEDKTSAPAPPPAETAAAPSDVAGARAPSDRP